MIREVVWCLFILIFISGRHCSPTDRDLYVFSSLANIAQSTTEGQSSGDDVQDSETAETNTYSNPYGVTTEFVSEESALEDSKEDPPGPEDHVIPHSEHEDPEEVPTRPKYIAPGAWAKPDPKKNIPLDFVPTKTLAQVRGIHTVKVLPQSEAIASATSDEERANAPRLREVVSKKKTNTIYTEEGYEDSAYDHAGHIRDADFHEGYAKKLHDQRGSKSRSGAGGKKNSKRGKLKNINSGSTPEEFEEFTDDYSDEAASGEKYEAEGSSKKKKKKSDQINKIYKDMWKKTDVNPKIVAENEIEKLELDLKREDEEAEKGSENYGSNTHRDPHGYYQVQETDSEGSEFSPSTREDIESSTGYPSFGSKENFYKENYEATTVQFGTPAPDEFGKYEAATSSYEDPTTSRYYFPENYEGTTFNYDYRNNLRSGIGEAPTTANYGEIFWKYYQTKPAEDQSSGSYFQEQTTIQQPISVRETTTLGPFDEASKPVAVATINGHGPYLLVSENGETTQNPKHFGFEDFSYFSKPQNGHANPNMISDKDYGFPSSEGIDSGSRYSFPGFGDSNGPTTSAYDGWGVNSEAYEIRKMPFISTETPFTGFFDSVAFSSTPTYSTITTPPNERESLEATLRKDPSHRKNPFFDSAEVTDRSDDGNDHENFETSYESWPRNNKNPSARGGDQFVFGAGPNSLKAKSHGDRGNSFFGYKPNLEYSKMLRFIKSHQNGRHNGQKSESADAEDFTIMKPPALRESEFSDFTPNSYPNVADYSSVKQESESAQEVDDEKIDAKKIGAKHGSFHKEIHFKTPTFYGNNPTGVMNRKKLFPAAKLLPPSPNSRNNYADLSFANRDGFYEPFKYGNPQRKTHYRNGVKNYSPDPEQLARYLKNRKRPSRYVRSLDEAELSREKSAYALIEQERNAQFNFTSQDRESRKYRDAGEPRKLKSRVKRNLIPEEKQSVTENLTPLAKEVFLNENDSQIHDNRRLRNKRSHADLLDASHKIAGDVIDKEISSRFKSKDYDDDEEEEEEEEEEDEDEEAKREKQVEVDAPDLDYLDEIQDVNDIENIPTTTMASIDLKKYPFYKNAKVPSSSPLKYIINPKEVPKKTFGGMEFYDSRDRYVQCDEVDPNLEEVVPDDEQPVPNRGPKENLPRLRGLGDKLDCFKAKYFGENPFDNPLFFERQINQPTPPTELNPMELATRILKMPEENKDYLVPAQSRKPESTPIKRIDDIAQRSKNRNSGETSIAKSSTDSKPRTGRRNIASRGKVQEASTQNPRTQSRRTPKRRPVQTQQTTTTESPEIVSVTPYQKEVYDDVMGTIKNLASLYEMFGAQTISPLTESPVSSTNAGNIQGASSIRNVKTLNRVPAFGGKREKDFRPSGVTEIPFDEEIEGLIPPPEINMKPKIVPYRTNKVSYNTRVRTENPTRNGDKKIIGYFRTVMVHKRSLDDFGGDPIDLETSAGNHSVKKRNVLDSEIQETQANLQSVDSYGSSSTTEKSRRGKRRKTSLASTTTTTVAPVTSHSSIENETPKPTYTIRSRSRNSNDEKSTSRYGVFTKTQRTSTATDGRRNEPRYTEILRRRGGTVITTTTTPSSQNSVESNSTSLTEKSNVDGSSLQPAPESKDIYETNGSVPHRRKVSVEKTEPSSEIYETVASDFEPERVEEDEEDSEKYEEEGGESTEEPDKKIRKYDVHEDVQEDTTPSVTGFLNPTKTSEYVDLESYLSTDPPGFTKAFPDETGTTAPYVNPDESGDTKDNYRNDESKEESAAENDEEHPETPQNASYQEEESSDEDATESPRSSESYKDSSSENLDESGEEKKSSEQEDGDDKTFFRYDVRPQSPFESYEDEKYSELGPRINKPAFHHPSFEAPKYERHYFTDSEEEEKDKSDESLEREKYVFPWAHDEEDEKAEAEEAARYGETVTETYEYPWEKRERLAKERAKRRKDRERLKELKDFSFLQDDDDDYDDVDEKKASSSETSKKHVYPWDIYDVPSKGYKKNFSKKEPLDSHETSSEHRPIAKFSSKYNSNKFKLPFADSEPITVAQPKEIRESVLKFLEEADEKTVEPTVAYETDISTKSVIQTKIPDPTEKSFPTAEPVSSGSKSNKRISNSRIIPENITSAPRSKSRNRGTPVRERITLRPSIRPTTETVGVAKAQTTEEPVLSTKRSSRLRGGSNSIRRQPSYHGAQVSQTASSTVSPTPRSTTTSTTEGPVKLLSKNPSRFTVRQRGKSKKISDTGKTEIETSRKSQDVTERSTQATTTTRRRTRPTATTRPTTTKKAPKNYENAKKPSRVDTKNLLKEMTYDEYRIPTMSSVNSGSRDMEDSTPTSRTIEHRSRVSKEQLITKTSFPVLNKGPKFSKDKSNGKKFSTFNENFDDESLASQKSIKTDSETADREKKSFGESKGVSEKPVRNENTEILSTTTTGAPKQVHETTEVVDHQDDHKKIFASIIPKNRTVGPSALEDELHLKKAKMEIVEKPKEPRYENFDETETQNAESNRDIGSTLSDDMLPVEVLPVIPPRSNQLKETTDDYSEEYRNSGGDLSMEHENRYREQQGDNESEEDDESEEESPVAKFEKDPNLRLYYYLDHKK